MNLGKALLYQVKELRFKTMGGGISMLHSGCRAENGPKGAALGGGGGLQSILPER